MKPSIHMTSGIATLAAAALLTGCCGPDGERRSALHRSPASTAYYSDTSQIDTTATATPATTIRPTDTERTRVREATGADTAGAADYSLPLYSERLQVGKREVENGSVRLRKVVRTENVSEPIELRRETVVIDREAFDEARRAADAGQRSDFGTRFEEKEIVIDLKRDEPVVEVQPFVSGRIIAQKKSQTERQTVQRQIRREEVEVLKTGNEQDITITERVRSVRVEGVGAPGTRTGATTGSAAERTEREQSQPQTEPETPPPAQPQP